jgi:hypothetical protein
LLTEVGGKLKPKARCLISLETDAHPWPGAAL